MSSYLYIYIYINVYNRYTLSINDIPLLEAIQNARSTSSSLSSEASSEADSDPKNSVSGPVSGPEQSVLLNSLLKVAVLMSCITGAVKAGNWVSSDEREGADEGADSNVESVESSTNTITTKNNSTNSTESKIGKTQYEEFAKVHPAFQAINKYYSAHHAGSTESTKSTESKGGDPHARSVENLLPLLIEELASQEEVGISLAPEGAGAGSKVYLDRSLRMYIQRCIIPSLADEIEYRNLQSECINTFLDVRITGSVGECLPMCGHNTSDTSDTSNTNPLNIVPDAIPRLQKLQKLLDNSSVGKRSVALLRASQSVCQYGGTQNYEEL